MQERDFAVAPLGPWLTLILGTLAAPLQAVGLALLRLASRKVAESQSGEDETCVDWLPEPFRRPILGFFGFVLLAAGLALSSLEMLMGAGVHDQGLDAVIVMRKVVLLLQCTQVLLCYVLERFFVTRAELPSLHSKVCMAVWLGSSLLEWASPWPHDDTSEVLKNQRAGCDDGFRALFTFVYFPLWATSLCFGVIVLGCLDDGASGGREYDEQLDEEGDDKSSDSEECESEQMRRAHRREREAENRRHKELKGFAVGEPTVKLFRRVLLPLIYGFATSASGLLIATGWTTIRWRLWAGLGGILLFIAAACALDWILRLELSLGVWAPLSQCCATLLRLFQGHLIFKDFRWSAEEGLDFSVGKKPGVYCFLTGVTILLGVLLLYVLTYQWNEWLKSEATPSEHSIMRSLTTRDVQAALARQMSRLSDGRRPEGDMDLGRDFCRILRVLLLPVCFACYLRGISSPLYHYSICTPDVQWVNSQAQVERWLQKKAGAQSCMGHTMGFVDSITWLYDNRMPFSAMLAAYRSLVGPPLEFCAVIMYLILQPLGFVEIPVPVLHAMRSWLIGGASSKFATNCMVCILYVTIIQSADPGGNSFQAQFTRGFAFMMMYCVSYGGLVRSLPDEEVGLQERGDPSILDPHESVENTGSNDSSEEEDTPLQRVCDWWETAKDIMLALFMFSVVICAMYYSITTCFISLDFRYSGTKLLSIQPVLMDLWQTLLKVDLPVAVFAASTMMGLLLLRIVLWFWLHTVYREDPMKRSHSRHNVSHHKCCTFKALLEWLEALAAQFTLCHIWAEAIVLLWLGILTRNRDTYQVCASLPSPPFGLIAFGVLGLGGWLLHRLIPKATTAPNSSPRPPGRFSRLPGGPILWGGGYVTVYMGWAGLMASNGPSMMPSTMSRDEVNEVIAGLLPKMNSKMGRLLPESKGDCAALWLRFANEHPRCVGQSALARIITKDEWDVSVLWATGLNQVIITDMQLDTPSWASPGKRTQNWHLTVTGVFPHLKVWVRAEKNGEEWINNYVCCNKNFSFTVQATTACSQGFGFDNITMRMVRMDRPEMESTVTQWDLPDSHGELTVDFGDVNTVGSLDLKKVIEDYLTGKVGGGRLLMRTSEGPPLDVMDYLRVRLQEVVLLNTRPHRFCPFQPPPPPTTMRPFVEAPSHGGRPPPDARSSAFAAAQDSDTEEAEEDTQWR